MSGLELIINKSKTEASLKIERLFLVRNLRILFLAALMVAFLVIQFSQNLFFNHGLQLPILGGLSISFLANLFYLIYFEKVKNRIAVNWSLFAVDALAFTVLVYCFGSRFSLFVFLYLVNIVLAGLVFERRGAVYLAAFTSLLYSFQILVTPTPADEASSIIFAINTTMFFVVAYFSGSLSEQFRTQEAELQVAGRELQILKNINDLIVGNITSGLVSTNSHGRVLFANSIIQRLFPESSFDHIQKFLPQIWHEVGLRLRNEDDLKFRREVIVVGQHTRTYEVLCSPLKDEHDKERGFLFLIQDLTGIKNLESQLKQKEKLAAVGQLAAGIAHEIRNPLASISGSVQMLSTQFQSVGPDEQKLFRIVLREIDRLNELITEFLDYVKPEPQPADPINVNDILEETMKTVTVNDQLPKGVSQTGTLQARQTIVGHPNKLKQAFLNIIMNAYQAMARSETKTLTVTTYDDHDRVVVMISDTGSGIAAENIARIFEPFFTTKNDGTGLGLAMTYKIFENHNAPIEVESELGEGTRFRIYFPAFGLSGNETMPIRKRA